MTLVNKILEASGAQLYNTSSLYCFVCSPPQMKFPFINIYPPFYFKYFFCPFFLCYPRISIKHLMVHSLGAVTQVTNELFICIHLLFFCFVGWIFSIELLILKDIEVFKSSHSFFKNLHMLFNSSRVFFSSVIILLTYRTLFLITISIASLTFPMPWEHYTLF